MDCSTPGFPVLHYLPELAQTHVHWVGDAIQPSHPLLSPSPSALNLSQHQGLFQWVSSSHQVAEVLELQLQHQSFQWLFRTDFLQDGLVGSPCCLRSSQESSSTPQFFGAQLSLRSDSHPYMTIGKTIALTKWTFVCKVMSLLFPSMVLYLSNSPDKKIKLTLTGKVLHQPAVGSSSDLLWFTNYSPHIHRQSTDISYRPEVTWTL